MHAEAEYLTKNLKPRVELLQHFVVSEGFIARAGGSYREGQILDSLNARCPDKVHVVHLYL